jgi:hypothetical protein
MPLPVQVAHPCSDTVYYLLYHRHHHANLLNSSIKHLNCIRAWGFTILFDDNNDDFLALRAGSTHRSALTRGQRGLSAAIPRNLHDPSLYETLEEEQQEQNFLRVWLNKLLYNYY